MSQTKPKGRQCNHCNAYFDDTTPEGAAHLASCKQYNGWTNYETWAVALWLDNDEGSYKHWRRQARAAISLPGDEVDGDDQAVLDKEVHDLAVRKLAEQLKEQHEEAAQNVLKKGGGEHTVFSDLSSAALSEVNWEEVAESRFEE